MIGEKLPFAGSPCQEDPSLMAGSSRWMCMTWGAPCREDVAPGAPAGCYLLMYGCWQGDKPTDTPHGKPPLQLLSSELIVTVAIKPWATTASGVCFLSVINHTPQLRPVDQSSPILDARAARDSITPNERTETQISVQIPPIGTADASPPEAAHRETKRLDLHHHRRRAHLYGPDRHDSRGPFPASA